MLNYKRVPFFLQLKIGKPSSQPTSRSPWVSSGRDHGGGEPVEIHAGTGFTQFFGSCFSGAGWLGRPMKGEQSEHNFWGLDGMFRELVLDGKAS